MSDPYEVLGITPYASDEEIKKAYRTLSRMYHPDANIDNPNRNLAEEKFKQVQQAYDQIMKEKQQGYSYGGSRSYGGHSSGGRDDSIELQAAANYIANRHFKEALHALHEVPSAQRGARWHYYSAMAHAAMGSNVTAKEHIEKAVALEPSSMEYRQFKQHLDFGGTWYQSMGESYEKPYAGAGSWCLSMLFLNMVCNCCCFGL